MNTRPGPWGVYREKIMGSASERARRIDSPANVGQPTDIFAEEEPRGYGSATATSISRNDDEQEPLPTLSTGSAPAVDRTDFPAGQPPAKVSAVPGKSGSSEVFRTQTGQLLDQTDDDERAGENTLIQEPDGTTKFVKYEGDTVIECVATDYSLKATWRKK